MFAVSFETLIGLTKLSGEESGVKRGERFFFERDGPDNTDAIKWKLSLHEALLEDDELKNYYAFLEKLEDVLTKGTNLLNGEK